jgi:hypothetical protein
VAALAAGSILWAASNNPLATAGEAAPTQTIATAQVASTQPAPATTDQLSIDQLRKKAKRLSRAVEKARQEARAAREAGIVIAASGGSTWVPSSQSGGGANVQPAPQPVPAPAPAADTWTGSSGG